MAFHVISRRLGGHVLWHNRAQLRRIVSIILRFARKYGVVLFAVANDHIHSVVVGDRAHAGRWARAMEGAITRALAQVPGFQPALILKVASAAHAAALVPYVLGQPDHHDILDDPLGECTNLLDLLGVRRAHGLGPMGLDELGVGFSREDLVHWLGGELQPGFDTSRLVEAASVVSAGRPFHAPCSFARELRFAAARQCRRAGLSIRATQDLLGISKSTVQRASRAADAELDQALLLALGLLERLQPLRRAA